MCRLLHPFLLLLLVGSSTAGRLFVRNDDGTFSGRIANNENSNEYSMTAMNVEPNVDREDSRLLRDEIPVTEKPDHIAKSPLDDEDLGLVQEYFQDQKINKTGQLRYSTLPLVEKALIKDLVLIILKNEEYMLLLNNPSFPDVTKMVKNMLRVPTQDVLQQQIWSKVLAVEAYYKKFYKPLNNPDTKREASEFLSHLKEASEDHKLTVDDTVKLSEKMQLLAFLIQEKVFNEKMTQLESTFDEATQQLTGSHLERKSANSENRNINNNKDESVRRNLKDVGHPRRNSTEMDVYGTELKSTGPSDILQDNNNDTVSIDLKNGELLPLPNKNFNDGDASSAAVRRNFNDNDDESVWESLKPERFDTAAMDASPTAPHRSLNDNDVHPSPVHRNLMENNHEADWENPYVEGSDNTLTDVNSIAPHRDTDNETVSIDLKNGELLPLPNRNFNDNDDEAVWKSLKPEGFDTAPTDVFPTVPHRNFNDNDAHPTPVHRNFMENDDEAVWKNLKAEESSATPIPIDLMSGGLLPAEIGKFVNNRAQDVTTTSPKTNVTASTPHDQQDLTTRSDRTTQRVSSGKPSVSTTSTGTTHNVQSEATGDLGTTTTRGATRYTRPGRPVQTTPDLSGTTGRASSDVETTTFPYRTTSSGEPRDLTTHVPSGSTHRSGTTRHRGTTRRSRTTRNTPSGTPQFHTTHTPSGTTGRVSSDVETTTFPYRTTSSGEPRDLTTHVPSGTTRHRGTTRRSRTTRNTPSGTPQFHTTHNPSGTTGRVSSDVETTTFPYRTTSSGEPRDLTTHVPSGTTHRSDTTRHRGTTRRSRTTRNTPSGTPQFHTTHNPSGTTGRVSSDVETTTFPYHTTSSGELRDLTTRVPSGTTHRSGTTRHRGTTRQSRTTRNTPSGSPRFQSTHDPSGTTGRARPDESDGLTTVASSGSGQTRAPTASDGITKYPPYGFTY